MGAIAVAKREERRTERLWHEVHDSVRRCAAADKREHPEIVHVAVGRWALKI